MLGAAASKALRRLENARVPPRGTGPLDGGGSRWISVSDVLVWNAKTDVRCEHAEWDPETDPVYPRTFSEAEIPLRDYQVSACDSAHVDGRVFKSGSIVMGCGDGKSRVAAELIRRSRAPAVILAPGTVCVEQWVRLVRDFVTADVCTLTDVRHDWRIHMPLPSVVVTTYHSLVRVTKQMRTHRARLESEGGHEDDHFEDRLLMTLMCERFGLLIMDEVHVAVADYFISAGYLRASAVYGLSGSLVREDERISRLIDSVGPTLFTHFTQRNVQIEIVAVPMGDDHRARVAAMSKRSKWEQTLRAMNPYKVHALATVLRRHASERVLVFCDILRVAELLHNHHPRSLLMTGRDDATVRDAVLDAFRCATDGAVLVCTHVGDASINFPPGCVVVQFHISNGSRQQEVQRCGRGTRDLSAHPTYMYHLVNQGTEETDYVERRVAHLMECLPDGCALTRTVVGDDAVLDEAHLQMSREAQKIVVHLPRARGQTSNVRRQVEKMLSKRQRTSSHGEP